MYLDQELITRTCAWNGPGNEVLDDWNAILDHLRLDDALKRHAARVLKALGEQQLPRPADRPFPPEGDAASVQACQPGREHPMAPCMGTRRRCPDHTAPVPRHTPSTPPP